MRVAGVPPAASVPHSAGPAPGGEVGRWGHSPSFRAQPGLSWGSQAASPQGSPLELCQEIMGSVVLSESATGGGDEAMAVSGSPL